MSLSKKKRAGLAIAGLAIAGAAIAGVAIAASASTDAPDESNQQITPDPTSDDQTPQEHPGSTPEPVEELNIYTTPSDS